MDTRFQQLKTWLLDDLKITVSELAPASADASFRRYFRATIPQGSFVVMDAPPDKEAIEPFVNIAQALRQQGVHAPKVYEANYQDGFLLLEDLGNRTYLNELKQDSDKLYSAAIDSLLKIQIGQYAQVGLSLPRYNKDRLILESDLFKEWFINNHLDKEIDAHSLHIFDQCVHFLIDEFSQQPQVWVHRDYHSRNLMITNQNSPGVIDFQDMVIGPIAYDLVSMYKDCYIEWPRSKQLSWLKNYHQRAQREPTLPKFSLRSLIRWYDLCGLQRHLKVLGLFCRLHYRDGKQHYLADLPLVAKYILEVIDLYPELDEFKQSFAKYIGRVL